ncbi:alpha/beta hydrolase [Legionella nagasakiensis]|uniref:alpha/beta hydrolase n=1 Tax=Legionella nagasakiensis TaxID=535290 RepID=UPI0010559921|nr:alpha/beta hydrolase [Legionella nagasakiensis]
MIKHLVIISLLAFGILVACIYLRQRHLIYFPLHDMPKPIDFQASDMGVIALKTQDGLQLSAWYKPAVKPHPTVLYLHGNAGHIGYRIPLARQFMNEGLGVLLLEYRGYGGNAGYPSEQGLYMDARAAMHFLKTQGIRPEKVVLYGESLGTGVATQLASEYQVCSMILQSPFTSLTNLARYHYPWIFIKPWDRFNSLKRIKSIHTPLLIIHGERDQIVPHQQGLALYDAANQPKKIYLLPQRGHNDLWGESTFSEEVIRFIKEHC